MQTDFTSCPHAAFVSSVLVSLDLILYLHLYSPFLQQHVITAWPLTLPCWVTWCRAVTLHPYMVKYVFSKDWTVGPEQDPHTQSPAPPWPRGVRCGRSSGIKYSLYSPPTQTPLVFIKPESSCSPSGNCCFQTHTAVCSCCVSCEVNVRGALTDSSPFTDLCSGSCRRPCPCLC